tara:strand:- start:256 stop:1500 length:1245 start_codon:yes stop_codon:yes gene_type:complete
MPNNAPVSTMHQPLTPDYYSYEWAAVESASCSTDGGVVASWKDGTQLECHPLWLRENAPGPGGIDPQSKENDLDIVDLNLETRITNAHIEDGALVVRFEPEGRSVTFHPGWLRHVAEGGHQPFASLPEPQLWKATDFKEPPTYDGSSVLESDQVLSQWLDDLLTHGMARLTGLPTTTNTVQAVANRIGVLRETNFGTTWNVSVDLNPNSTANTSMGLPAHSDLPSRETPPGFQLLHCLKNTVHGGSSTMTDGLAVAKYFEDEEPEIFELLTSKKWTFSNRDGCEDHRWTGPIIDKGDGRVPWTFRAFHPVRGFPAMPYRDITNAYLAMQRLGHVANSDVFQIQYDFLPGDLVAFDNRRILHGRTAFDSTSGSRKLRGTYLDCDEVYSRVRVLQRHLATTSANKSLPTARKDCNA